MIVFILNNEYAADGFSGVFKTRGAAASKLAKGQHITTHVVGGKQLHLTTRERIVRAVPTYGPYELFIARGNNPQSRIFAQWEWADYEGCLDGFFHEGTFKTVAQAVDALNKEVERRNY
jgi:hypothetical protein